MKQKSAIEIEQDLLRFQTVAKGEIDSWNRHIHAVLLEHLRMFRSRHHESSQIVLDIFRNSLNFSKILLSEYLSEFRFQTEEEIPLIDHPISSDATSFNPDSDVSKIAIFWQNEQQDDVQEVVAKAQKPSKNSKKQQSSPIVLRELREQRDVEDKVKRMNNLITQQGDYFDEFMKEISLLISCWQLPNRDEIMPDIADQQELVKEQVVFQIPEALKQQWRTSILYVIEGLHQDNIKAIEQEYRQDYIMFITNVIEKKKPLIQEAKHWMSTVALFKSQRKACEQLIVLQLHPSEIDIYQVPQIIKEAQKIKIEIKERMFDFQKICRRHQCKETVNYLCVSQYIHQEKYICDKCLTTQEHFGHQIFCKKHHSPIKYLVITASQDQTNEHQKYICQICFKMLELKTEDVVHLNPCHLTPVKWVCIEEQCVRQDKFKICPSCPDTHKGHPKIEFNSQFLYQFFFIKSDDLDVFQQNFLNIKQKQKLGTIKKAVDKCRLNLKQVEKFIQCFAIHNNQLMRKWIQLTMSECDKENVMVLSIFNQFKFKQRTSKQKSRFLQVFKDQLQHQLEIVAKKTAENLEIFRQKVRKLIRLDDDKIKDHLKHKYREIVCINQDDSQIQTINEELLCFVMKLQAYQDSEHQNYRDSAQKSLQHATKMYFNGTFQQKLLQHNVSDVDKRKILNQISYQQPLIQYGSQEEENNEPYSKLVKEIRQQLDELSHSIRSQYSIPPILTVFLSHQLTNLRIFRLIYQTKNEFSSSSNVYFVDSFVLFKATHSVTSLQQMTLRGITITNFELFVKFTAATINNTISTLQLTVQQSKLLGGQDHTWIQMFSPLAVDACLEGTVKFNPWEDNVQQAANALRQFIRLFASISLTVNIDMHSKQLQQSEQLQQRLAAVFQCIGFIKNLKISIFTFHSFNIDIFPKITEKLPLLASLERLQCHNFDLQRLNRVNILKIQQNLRQTFVNNTITHLRLINCALFPNPSSITSLKVLDYQTIKSIQAGTSLPQLIHNNRQLRQIIIQEERSSNSDVLKGFINLAQLPLIKTLSIEFKYLDLSRLSFMPFSAIKYLQLSGISKLESQQLRQLFSKLTVLARLRLSNSRINGKTLIAIPSLQLKQIQFSFVRQFYNQDLYQVDCKWPLMSILRLKDCPDINGKLFGMCRFRGLIQLSLSKKLLEESDKVHDCLKRKGIQVMIYQSNIIRLQKDR